MMVDLLNTLTGIILSDDGFTFTIMTESGGRISVPKVDGLTTGDSIAFTTNVTDTRVVEVIHKKIADEIVKRWVDPIYMFADREPDEREEETDYGTRDLDEPIWD